ncbi:MAG: hypothetical protein IPM29_30950 [Planctomycetes bacterium]|nr:hypothetical protein [Planctomycetota bacterium]
MSSSIDVTVTTAALAYARARDALANGALDAVQRILATIALPEHGPRTSAEVRAWAQLRAVHRDLHEALEAELTAARDALAAVRRGRRTLRHLRPDASGGRP